MRDMEHSPERRAGSRVCLNAIALRGRPAPHDRYRNSSIAVSIAPARVNFEPCSNADKGGNGKQGGVAAAHERLGGG